MQLGPFEIGWHGVFTVLAIFVGIQVGLRGARRLGVGEERITPILTWAIAGAFIGARLFHVADHLAYFAEHPLEVFAIWQGGIAVWGSFIGAIVAGLIAARGQRLPIWSLLDVAAPAILIGQAIGRLGCLSNGDAWGAPTGAAWGIVYAHPNDRLPADLLGVPTHPYPLYELTADLALAALLVVATRRLARPGDAFLLGALGYAAIRFVLTFYRQETVLFAGLQEAQLIAIGVAALAAGIALARGIRRPIPAGGTT